jgi:hypothetical protein
MRQWVVLVLFLLALGTLRVVGCGDEGPCYDGNPCTQDSCREYDSLSCEDGDCTCVNAPITDGTPCGSGNVCVEGVCGENLCEGVD